MLCVVLSVIWCWAAAAVRGVLACCDLFYNALELVGCAPETAAVSVVTWLVMINSQ
jgi:hypothetical protein